MSVVLAALFMAVLDSFIVVVADPSIVADLHASDGDVQWVLAGYQLSYAVFIITATRPGRHARPQAGSSSSA
ncbi:hypothetical protein LT493_32530 [Streptomyces tricolor]|nr:hypothetical protein [Streptomyces tricolor]